MLTATSTVPPIPDLKIDTAGIAARLAAGMLAHWSAQLASGKQPDGTSLPPNQEGGPMGVGGGSLTIGWVATKPRRAGTTSTVDASPRRDGKWPIVESVLRRKGVQFTAVTGTAKVEFDRLIGLEVEKIRAAIAARK